MSAGETSWCIFDETGSLDVTDAPCDSAGADLIYSSAI